MHGEIWNPSQQALRAHIPSSPPTADNAFLNAWLDYDRNGVFDPGLEQALMDISVSSGCH